MGAISSAFWNFVNHTEDQIKDGTQDIINGDDNLLAAEESVAPIWNAAKNLKDDWKDIQNHQRDTDEWDMNHWGPEHIDERMLDLVEDFGIEEANDLGLIDMVDNTVKVIEDPFNMESQMKLFVASRWVFNFFLLAWPWAFFSFLMFAYNIVFNAWLNKWWALGNFYLIFNTYICWFQWLNSMGLFFEWPFYMRQFLLERWMSVFTAWIYNIIYFSFLGAWLWQLFDMTDTELEEVGSFDVLLNMFFIYNCILHSSIVLINAGIIVKEISLEFFEMFKVSGGAGSDYNLSFARVIEDFEEEMWWADPVKLFKKGFSFIMGDTLTDEIDKNPDLAPQWDAAMDSLGDWADYGHPEWSTFNYDDYPFTKDFVPPS